MPVKHARSHVRTPPAAALDRFVPYRLSVLANIVSMSIAGAYEREFGLTDPAVARDRRAGALPGPVGGRSRRAHGDGQGRRQPRRAGPARPRRLRARLRRRRTGAARVLRLSSARQSVYTARRAARARLRAQLLDALSPPTSRPVRWTAWSDACSSAPGGSDRPGRACIIRAATLRRFARPLNSRMLGHAIPAARQELIDRIAASVAPPAQALPIRCRRTDFVRQYYHGVAEDDLPSTQRRPGGAPRWRTCASRSVRKPRAAAGARVQPGAKHATAGRRRTRSSWSHRRHAVPGRLARHGAARRPASTIHLLVHPVLAVRRDRRGRLHRARLEATAPTGSSRLESWQHIEIDRSGDAQRLRELEQKIQRTLDDVQRRGRRLARRCAQRAVEVAQRDRRAQPPPASASEVREAKALLEWMADNHFTFLGYREYRLRRGRAEDVLEPLPRNRPRHPARATRHRKPSRPC